MSQRSTKADQIAEQQRITEYVRTIQTAVLDLATDPVRDDWRQSQHHYSFFGSLIAGDLEQILAQYADRPMLQRAALAPSKA